MRKIAVIGNETIHIGRRGENQAIQIVWTNILENWRTMYGEGVVQLAVRRPKDTAPYPVACEVSGNDVMWTIQAADTAQSGVGECELSYIVDAVLVKSQTWNTMIARSLTGVGTVEPPSEPAKTWFTKIQTEIGNLEDLETGDKSNLVAAINEVAQTGSGGGSTVELDTTLTQSGKAADAKAVGDALENCVMAEKIDQEGGQGEFIPLLSADGTEYRFYIGNDGIPAVMDVNGRVVWTGTSGGSGGSGGDTGGDTGESWVNGEKVSPALVEAEYVNKTNGSFVAYNGWSRTDYIYCAGAETLELSGVRDSWSSSNEYNAFYDAEKNFIKTFANGLSTSNPSRIKIPEGACYFVLSGISDEMSVVNYTLRKEASIESWVNGKTVHITESVLIQNEYVNSPNGTFIASDGWSRTPYINCAGAKQIRFNLDTGFGHRSDGYNGFYDISKTFIKSFENRLPYRENAGPNYPTYVDVPDGACYFVLSWPHEDMIRLSYTLFDTVQEVTG